MKKEDDQKNYSRRAFLETGIVGGVGLALGLTAGEILLGSDKETVRLLTASGEVVEVEKRFLPPSSGEKVSNAALQTWMKEKKQ